MKFNVIQRSFISGELNPDSLGRQDIAQYNTGLNRARNVMILPQGSLIKRWGLKYHTSTQEDRRGHRVKGVTAIPFNFGDNNIYVIWMKVLSYPRAIQMYVFKNDSTESLNASPIEYTDAGSISDWYSIDVHDFDFTQYADTIIVCHTYMRPFSIVRSLVDGREVWSAKVINFDSFPYQEIVPGKKEIAWSAERGWPETCCFYENRLFFAANRYFPQTLWGSKSGLYYSFKIEDNPTEVKDTDALSVTLLTSSLSKIQNILAYSRLVLFTTGGQWFIDEKPLTPKNFNRFIRQSDYSSSRIKPAVVEDGIVFNQRRSNSIRLFQWDSDLNNFISTSLSYLGGHLIKDPVDMATVPNLHGGGGDHIFVINKDGTVAVCNIDLYQKSLSWVLWSSHLSFKRVTSSGGRVFFTMYDQKEDAYFLTRLDEKSTVDLAYFTEVNFRAKVPTLALEDNYRVKEGIMIKVQDRFFGPYRSNDYSCVSASGCIFKGLFDERDDSDDGYELIEVGLKIKMEVEVLPLSFNSAQGDLSYRTKRLNSIYLNLVKSVGHKLIYKGIEYQHGAYAGGNSLSFEVVKFSGIQKYNIIGLSDITNFIIIHDVPYRFKLLSIKQDFSIG